MTDYWKIGELAEITGLTVRTLRYYDQIGLFPPSDYSESGHRIYYSRDLPKLQQILSLKYIGLSLQEIQAYLSDSQNNNPSQILSIQINRLEEKIGKQQILLTELKHALVMTESHQDLSAEQVTKILGAMKMDKEKYFSPEQLDQMRKQYENLDKELLETEMKEFSLLSDRIREHMEKGTSQKNSEIQQLVTQWQCIVSKFSPKNDSDFIEAAEKFHTANPGNELQQGISKELYQYINQALQNL